ncbi:GFA family protein [Vibrio splendidus]
MQTIKGFSIIINTGLTRSGAWMDINHIKDRNIRSCECRCGAVNLVCRGEPQRTSVCHCYECQKRTGSVFGVQARFPIKQVTLNGEVTSFSRISDTGSEVTYQFFPKCGTTMLLQSVAAADFYIVPLGLFKEQDFPLPSFSVYEERKHGWVKFDHQMSHYN